MPCGAGISIVWRTDYVWLSQTAFGLFGTDVGTLVMSWGAEPIQRMDMYVGFGSILPVLITYHVQ